MVWPAIIAAAGALGSAWLNNRGQNEANETNLQLGREQMAFQERMSNTGYQRAVKDMQDAGLNPMLAYQQGAASSPTGSLPQVQNTLAGSAQIINQGVNNVLTAMQTQAGTKKLEAETDKIKSETLSNDTATAAQAAALQKLMAERDTATVEAEVKRRTQGHSVTRAISEAEHAELEARLRQASFDADVKRRKAEADIRGYQVPGAKAEAEFMSSDFGEMTPLLREIFKIIRGLSSARQAMP